MLQDFKSMYDHFINNRCYYRVKDIFLQSNENMLEG